MGVVAHTFNSWRQRQGILCEFKPVLVYKMIPCFKELLIYIYIELTAFKLINMATLKLPHVIKTKTGKFQVHNILTTVTMLHIRHLELTYLVMPPSPYLPHPLP